MQIYAHHAKWRLIKRVTVTDIDIYGDDTVSAVANFLSSSFLFYCRLLSNTLLRSLPALYPVYAAIIYTW